MKSMIAEVAMNALFSRLNAAIAKPLIAPPVPNNPAEKPEREPPIKAFLLFGLMIKSFLIKKIKLKMTKKIPSITSNKKLFK